jgi:hypothetical protein
MAYRYSYKKVYLDTRFNNETVWDLQGIFIFFIKLNKTFLSCSNKKWDRDLILIKEMKQ